LRFGLALPQYDFSLPNTPVDWSTLLGWAKRAEEMGFDSVWVSDHLFLDLGRYGGSEERQSAMECFTSLAALSVSTQRVRLGTLVVCNDLRPPTLVAKMAAGIDVLSGGRLELGVGAGWYEPEYRAAGIEFSSPGVRITRLGEAVRIIIGMLSSESFSFEGEHYRVAEARNLPRPVQSPRPPVWIGGKGDRITALAGRLADGYNSVWSWTPEAFADRLKIVHRAARNVGRDPASVRKSVGLYCLPAAGDAELRARWQRYLEVSPVEVDASFDEWRTGKLAGTIAEMLETIAAFEELGVEEVILGFGVLPFQIADASAVEFFAGEVLPQGR
jgi:probable F420-dependent oxidoreductase